MKLIGILSDTHSHWDERYAHYFKDCDEIWHAGDFGSLDIADRLKAIAPLRGVCGNIDGTDVRREYPVAQRFTVEGVTVLMKHIGGYPGRYDRSVATELRYRTPRLFVCGHSHIAKVMYDRQLGMLHINPGAAGVYGQQPVRTLVRLVIDGENIKDLEMIELREMEGL